MKTIEEYETEVMATPLRGEVATRFTVAEVKRIQSDAFAAGRAQGEIVGMHKAASMIRDGAERATGSRYHGLAVEIERAAESLEREQQTKL